MAGSKASETSRDVLQRLSPSLRRFAHALVGGQARGGTADALLDSAIERIDTVTDGSEATLKPALYRTVVTTNRSRLVGRVPDTEPFRIPVRGIAQAIERLPLDQREVLLLVVLAQFSYDQTATILGMPRSSVLARLLRARAALAVTQDLPHHRPAYLRVVK